MNILPDELKHLKGTLLGNELEAIILRNWIVTSVKLVVFILFVAAALKYIL